LNANGASSQDATIACQSCGAHYPLLDGMPSLLPGKDIDTGTQRAFGRQWTMQDEGSYEQETIYGETAEAELQSFLDRFGIRSPEELRGKRILDIGCGSGRLTRNLALYAPDAFVVGGDLSDAARIAHRRCRDLPNAVVAQLDCLKPPFASRTFDYIYADGILPAVPALEPALASLDRLMRPGGKFFAWVYPRTFSPYRLIRDVLVRPDRLPLGVQRSIEWVAGVPLWAAFKIWEPLRGSRRRSLGEVIFTLHDNLAPPNQHRRRPAEMASALQRLGYTHVQALPPHTGIVGTKQSG
jgi:SAM-dependent methyltransferase